MNRSRPISTDLAAALGRIPLFADVPGPVLARMAAQSRWVAAAPGALVLDFNDPTTDVLFVAQGAIRVSVHTADGGHLRILGDVPVGGMVGEMSAIDGAPRSARVEALVRTRLCLVPAEAFLHTAAAVPAVSLRIMQLLTARIRGQTTVLLEHTALPIRLRLAAELLRLARTRPDGARVVSPLPNQTELANRVGSRRETVSRELGALERAGLLRRSRVSILLADPAALEELVRLGAE